MGLSSEHLIVEFVVITTESEPANFSDTLIAQDVSFKPLQSASGLLHKVSRGPPGACRMYLLPPEPHQAVRSSFKTRTNHRELTKLVVELTKVVKLRLETLRGAERELPEPTSRRVRRCRLGDEAGDGFCAPVSGLCHSDRAATHFFSDRSSEILQQLF